MKVLNQTTIFPPLSSKEFSHGIQAFVSEPSRGEEEARNFTDELAIVKAAAWAWFQHGSGSEGNAVNEFDTRSSLRAPRPSRYKLEAMRMAKEAEHSKKSLLDTVEVETISRRSDSFIESTNSEVANCNTKMMGKGFWLRHAVVCGTREDVVDARVLSAKHVPMAKCMPRSNGALRSLLYWILVWQLAIYMYQVLVLYILSVSL